MNVGKALKNTRGKIFIYVINNPGLFVSELAEKIGITQPSMTIALRILEKNKFIKVQFDDKNGVIKKRIYPTFRGQFESVANSLGSTFTNEVYDDIDNFLFHPEIKPILFESLPKEKMDITAIVSSIMLFTLRPHVLDRINKIIEKDKNLKMIYSRGITAYLEGLGKKIKV